MKLRVVLASFVLLPWSPGCVGTETGNPTVTAEFALNTHSSAPNLVSLRDGDAPLVVQEVWLSLGAIALREGTNCADATELFSSAPLGAADHAHPDSALTDFELPAGNYGCMSAALVVAQGTLPEAAPAELAGRSMLIRAVLDGTTPVTVTTDAEIQVPIAALAGSFSLRSDQTSFFLGFDVAKWLAPLDLAEAEFEADGSVRISSSENKPLYEKFVINVPSGLELYRDVDGDGMLDEAPELLGIGEGP